MSLLSTHPQQTASCAYDRVVVVQEATKQVQQSHSQRKFNAKLSLWQRVLRKLTFARLKQITHGVLTVETAGERYQFGAVEPGEPQATLHIGDARFFEQLVLGGSLGAAEAYLRGYWHTDDLLALMRLMIRNAPASASIETNAQHWLKPWTRLRNWLTRNTHSGSRRNISAHYDLSNEFFATFLDPTMAYSSGIFETPESTLTAASIAKFERICSKLRLEPSDHLLEIGTGWGGFAIYAAQNYGCRVTTTTISQQQYDLAQQRIATAGLSDRITLLKKDYRDLAGSFDKLVSVEMIEAVGHEFLPAFFGQCCRLLKPAGLFVLQGITIPDQRYERYRGGIDFIQRYIFPGGCLPSLGAMLRATSMKTDFQLVHLEDFASHYAQTLAEWRNAFWAHEAQVRTLGMDDRFLRAWEYYFCYCQSGFEERQIGVAQLVFARPESRHAPLLGQLESR